MNNNKQEADRFSQNYIVSVVIPTHNSAKTLEKCLTSIINQTYKNYEIIVVDDFSTDKTREIVSRFRAKIFVRNRFLWAGARNLGSRNACGDFLLHIDSDMELTPHVIKECVNACISKHIDAIIIPEISIGANFWGKCKSLEKRMYVGDTLIEGPRFFSRKAYLNLGGYDDKIIAGEEWDMYNRLIAKGYVIERIHSYIVHNEDSPSLASLVRKKYLYGKTIAPYVHKYPHRATQQLIPIRSSFLRNWKSLLSLYGLGLIFMKNCEFMAGALGLLEGRIPHANC